MKKKLRPVVPAKAKSMVNTYLGMGYHVVPWRDKCLIRMEITPDGTLHDDKPFRIFILSYTSEGKVHPLAGMSLLNREKAT